MSEDSLKEAESVQRAGAEFTLRSASEETQSNRLREITLDLVPEWGPHWQMHCLSTMRRQTMARILYLDQLYRKIIDVPGVICEFGVQWGSSLATFMNLRSMYEPYNHSRTIFGFDTFDGFPSVDRKDGGHAQVGDYATQEGYKEVLEELLTIHEANAPLNHIKKFQLIQGDASLTIDKWLCEFPHALVALAHFDMDIYKPTKDVLEKLMPRLTKGSLLVFDELTGSIFEGESQALQEVIGLGNVSLRRHPHQPYCAWAVWGE